MAVRRSTSDRALPPPSSGLLVEVNFRRMLKCCEQIASGNHFGRNDLITWQSSPVFHQYLDTLQELLSDLESDPSRRCSRQLLKAYEQHVDQIAGQLQPKVLPAYCVPALPVPQHQTSTAAPSAPTLIAAGTALPPEPRRDPGAELRQRPAAPRVQLEGAALGRIEQQRTMQDALTQELVGMAAGLKRNAAAMQTAVADRGRLLEEADSALERNLAGAKKSAKESKVAYRKNSRSFWATLLLLFTISMVFVGMYLFIKVTSLAGYRRIAVRQ